MTPQEKAKQLIHDFIELNGNSFFAISNSLKCVDEVLNSIPSRGYWHTYSDEIPSAIIYWEEVKQELEKIKNK